MIHSCFSQGLPRLFLVVTVSEIQLVCFKALVKLFITFNGATARSNQYDLNALLHLTDGQHPLLHLFNTCVQSTTTHNNS